MKKIDFWVKIIYKSNNSLDWFSVCESPLVDTSKFNMLAQRVVILIIVACKATVGKLFVWVLLKSFWLGFDLSFLELLQTTPYEWSF